MLNINQNFDLKAPVFNFDRDYFNSVEELNAYDTSNVPDHFVTNVAGMLYQFTNGKWLPMIGTTDDDGPIINIGIGNIQITNQDPNPKVYFSTVNGFGSVYASTYLGYSSDDDNKHISLDVNDLYLMINDDSSATTFIYNDNINISGVNDSQKIQLNVNDTEAVNEDESNSPVNMSLIDGDNKVTINANNGLSIKDYQGQTVTINANDGFYQQTVDGPSALLDGYGLTLNNGAYGMNAIGSDSVIMYDNNNNSFIALRADEATDGNLFTLGTDNAFKISRPTDNTEGATITGVKSITAFANPSATKVWATDGSTVDLSTKANTSDLNAKANASDVLLKKSASGGYYIEQNSNALGWEAFAANSTCIASGNCSFAEGYGKATSPVAHAEGEYTTANGYASHAEGSYTLTSASNSHAEGTNSQAIDHSAHAEGYHTLAKGMASHAEGNYTVSNGHYSHAEGNYTKASGSCAHAQGAYNVDDKNAIHSVGIGNNTTRKNAEYIYAKHAEYGTDLTDDTKNGYKYLIGVGGYDGISTDNTTYKSVQEVIADLTARIEQLETKVRALEAANTPA